MEISKEDIELLLKHAESINWDVIKDLINMFVKAINFFLKFLSDLKPEQNLEIIDANELKLV